MGRFACRSTRGLIYDWNVCDWFCVKLLAPLIRRYGPACEVRVGAWRTAENLYRARASVVTFVDLADVRAWHPVIEESCRVLLTGDERFARTAAGWALREVSRHDEAFVRGVIEANLPRLSAERPANATKNVDAAVRERHAHLLPSG